MESNNVKPNFPKGALVFLKMCGILLISICAGVLMMCAAFSLPTAPMVQNLSESAPVFEKEGLYTNYLDWCSSTLDNFTDALMLLTAAYDGEEPAMEKSMLLYSKRTVESDPVASLIDFASHNSEPTIYPYARYWQGYLIYLKPLLLVFNYQQIRFLNQILQVGLVVLLLFILKRSGLDCYILPLLLTLGLLPIFATAQSLTCSDIFYLAMGGSCVLLWKRDAWRGTAKPIYFFLILGILTSFFDFLTYPLVSFGIPVCFYFCTEKKTTFFKQFRDFLLLGLSWSFGYAGQWAGKWAASSILTRQNIIAEGLGSVKFRSGSVLDDGTAVRLFDTIIRNLGAFVRNPFFLLFWLFCIGVLLLIIKRDCFSALRENLILLLVAILPFAWYIATKNHSYIHYFFTYKELVIFSFALMCFFTKSALPKRPPAPAKKKGRRV